MTTVVIILSVAALIFIVAAIAAVIWFLWFIGQLTDGTEDDPWGPPEKPPGDIPALPPDWPGRTRGPHYLGHPGCEPPVKGRAG